jgi:glycerate kinase
MKIVIAPDSFKESLSAPDVALAIERGIRRALKTATVVRVPMADGGEGTVEAILGATTSERRVNTVLDALGRPIEASWARLPEDGAVIEIACAAGLEHIPAAERDPLRATSYGVGQLISHALDSGAQHIVLGLGGSATNDAGAGMLEALGLRLLDKHGAPLARGGLALAQLAKLDASALDPRLATIRVTIASDVNNPLCGPKGAAGGLGFAAHAWLRSTFKPGAEVVAEIGGLAHAIEGADLVITGEGRMDAQTLLGKTPMGVAQIAKRAGVPVIAIAGSLGDGYQALYEAGIHAAFSLASGPCTLADACLNTSALLEDRTQDIIRVWLASRLSANAGSK